MVKTIASYQALKATTPDFEGQVVLLSAFYDDDWNSESNGVLYGRGEFIAIHGDVVDDGGFRCVPVGLSGLYWQRVIENDTLRPDYFGAKCNSIRTSAGTDATSALNNMFATAIARNFSIEFPAKIQGSSANERAFYVTSSINATGIHIIKGELLVHIKSSTFDKSKGQYALLLGDPSTDKSTIQNGLTFDSITVRDLDKRATEIGGVYLKYTAAFGQFIRAIDFNGCGIELAPVYDSTFSLITERCGNISNYAIFTNGNGDECNAVTVISLLCHDSYHKGIFFAGSKHNIINVHAEANSVLSIDDGYIGLTGSVTNTGLKYVNHVFYLVDGHLGNLSFNDYGNTNGKTYYGDKDTLNAVYGSHVAIALVKSTCDHVTNEITHVNGGNIGRVSFFTANTYSAIKHISAGHCYFENTSRVMVNDVNINTLYSWSNYTKLNGGLISNWGSRVIASLSDSRIDASSMSDLQSYINCIRCTFTNGITQLSPSQLNVFTLCTIPSIKLDAENSIEYGNFNNCDLGSSKGVAISGGTTSYPKELNIKGCELRNTWTVLTPYDILRFIGTSNQPKGNFNLINWSFPRQTRPGTIVHQPKTDYATGDVILSVCLTVNSSGINTWQEISRIE